MRKITVGLVDDHPVVLAGVRALLEAAEGIRVIGEATTGRAAMQMITEQHPDVAVIDISLPDLNGIELAEILRSRCPGVKLLGLTVHEDVSYLQQLLRAGVCGYVLKRSAADELLEAIEVIAQGGTYIDPTLADRVRGADHAGPGQCDDATLSPRERKVLRMTAQGFSNKEIAAFLSVSIKSVETYKARGADKLSLRTRSDIVRYAVSQGWLTGQTG